MSNSSNYTKDVVVFFDGLDNEYQLFSKVNRDISQNSYKDFIELFDILNNLNFKFQYGTMSQANRIDIFITNIEKFINEMEILKNANKYNL